MTAPITTNSGGGDDGDGLPGRPWTPPPPPSPDGGSPDGDGKHRK